MIRIWLTVHKMTSLVKVGLDRIGAVYVAGATNCAKNLN